MNHKKIRRLSLTLTLLSISIGSSAHAQSLELLPTHVDADEVQWLTDPNLGEELQSSLSIVTDQFDNKASSSGVSQKGLASSQTELIRQRFNNGNVHIEREVAQDVQGNYVNHGKYIEYNVKGEVVRSGNYTQGELEGEWRQTIGVEEARQLTNTLDGGFQPPFQSHATFLNGQLSGAWTVSDSKGNLVLIWQFENGNREDTSVWYNSRGAVIREVTFDSNVPHGPAIVNDSKTSKPQRIELDRGRIVQTKTDWYESRTQKKKKSESHVLVPYANEMAEHDWWNSRFSTQPAGSTEPVRHGLVSTWHPNGQLAFVGTYDQGKQNGEFVWYYENGQPQGRGQIEADAKVGEWTWWHPNGMKEATGYYDAGKPSGTWAAWAANGQLLQRGDAEAMIALRQQSEEAKPAERNDAPMRSATRGRTQTSSPQAPKR
ncbi:toxin-antitoxin system YwqK family antitoxin [Neorhodopirellula pilleata]|uniref:MORN repeat variant n=1 Tax=Neorhodopirellula pilleata TaxID=2714738 RepID=A0A5C6AQ96_9BACT|nr:hypothetical protein [Neorhodopirellula pilleata]TWU01399.1 MORN repeat variant [Neorhodopirellula pilleata]